MRTSQSQFTVMVEFMEKYGDLSKPTGGSRDRHYLQQKWQELSQNLNSDGSGDSRSEEKWRKVRSDLKNNTKKKCAKINKAAASGTGGGPALQLSLTDLENRVIQIMQGGAQLASDMGPGEAGFGQVYKEEEIERTPSTLPANIPPDELSEASSDTSETCLLDWNTPSTSHEPTVFPQPPVSPPGAVENQWMPKPPPKKKQKRDAVAELLIESERSARERDRVYAELKRERLRQREFEVCERVRQREVELQLQAQWLEFMKEALNVLVKYLDKK